MHHPSYRRLLRALTPAQRNGPVGLILVQDNIAVADSVQHYRQAGLRCLIGLGVHADEGKMFDHTAPFDVHKAGALAAATNALITTAPGAWIVPCWNGELLFWPHGDTRPLPDLFAFLDDERRGVLSGVVLDAYPSSSGTWRIDTQGYSERATGIHGGLRDRIGQPCPAAARRLDRPLAIKSRPGLQMGMDGHANDPALNQMHSEWHHSPTGALVSLRVWAWLQAQPHHLRHSISLDWPGSTTFPHEARTLWQHGMIEPGQWV